ncbi:MAG: cation-transporting P-type ATPase [Candidatus Brocadiia bacterium]
MTTSEFKKQIDNPHSKPIEQILDLLDSEKDGLASEDAEQRLDTFGPNRLPAGETEGVLKRFFKHFNDLLIYILIVASIITAILGHWIDTAVILSVVVINATIGFVQEGKAERALAGIRKLLSLHAHALRNGEWAEIEAERLVPGDIVRLRSGDRVPADVRLMDTSNLRIEESALTGESVPVTKDTETTPEDAGVGDRTGMAFSGSMVSAGRGTGVVVATGAATQIGQINTMISEVEKIATPLTRQMNRFGKVLSIVILGMAAVMGFIGWILHGMAAAELFMAAIGFAVAAIPEGLPAILTITLALGVQRMARRNAITRKLNAVETLGSVTTICSDKTGTLTKNEMTVRYAVTRHNVFEAEGTGYSPEGRIVRTEEAEAVSREQCQDLHRLIEVMAVCNDSDITQDEGRWRVTGEPTEGALRTLARKAEFDDSGYERLDAIPFESENKFMATLNRSPDGDNRILFKGAPDRLLECCEFEYGNDDAVEPLDKGFWEEEVEKLGKSGFRVLAAASRVTADAKETLDFEDLSNEMVFIGIVGIIDPPRPEAIEAIKMCHQAGIRVKIITGDHSGTAAAIGAEMGIGDGANAVTGGEIEDVSDEELSILARENDIFARTSPEHKLRLIKALQANNEVIAMTGDGVNDAPALKRADVGVAMGVKGTEATKEAADIVLADDNFTSIEHAVEEGRTIYDNLRKAILFILPTNGAESLVILTAVIFGLALPLTPVQILWVNLVTAVTLALALAFEPAEPGLMQRPPRDPGAPILGITFLWRIGFVALVIGGATIAIFSLGKYHFGISEALAQTIAVNTLVCGQAFYLFNSRYLHKSSLSITRLLSNRVAWVSIGALAVLQIMFVHAPFMHTLFGSSALRLRHWFLTLGVGMATFLLIELEKAVIRRLRTADPVENAVTPN